jgi:hypothetical protein
VSDEPEIDLSDQEIPENALAANEAIITQPGFIAFNEQTAFQSTIKDVVEPNWRELLAFMDAPGADPMLALELIQNVRPPAIRNQYKAVLNQRLHNYIASAFTLRDHSYTILHNGTSPVAADHKQRVAEMMKDLRMPFVQDLRNYMLHDYLPIVAHRVEVTNLNQPNMGMTAEHILSVPELRKSDAWSEKSQEFLATCGDTIDLRPLIHDHGAKVLKCNTELLNDLIRANEEHLRALDPLVVRANMALTGLSHQAAEELTRQITLQRGGDVPGTSDS